MSSIDQPESESVVFSKYIDSAKEVIESWISGVDFEADHLWIEKVILVLVTLYRFPRSWSDASFTIPTPDLKDDRTWWRGPTLQQCLKWGPPCKETVDDSANYRWMDIRTIKEALEKHTEATGYRKDISKLASDLYGLRGFPIEYLVASLPARLPEAKPILAGPVIELEGKMSECFKGRVEFWISSLVEKNHVFKTKKVIITAGPYRSYAVQWDYSTPGVLKLDFYSLSRFTAVPLPEELIEHI